jgi:glycosyltransferase involved in cell wall biosynthesis
MESFGTESPGRAEINDVHMRILAISEHFHPRVGGTVEYVSQTCSALQTLGHEVHLLIPGEGTEPTEIEGFPYRVTAMGGGWPTKGDPDRETRYRFCREISRHVECAADAGEVDLVHVLFGLFVNETLDTTRLQGRGVPCVTTIHNIPPQECGRSWAGDLRTEFWKDRLRLKVVAAKNRARLARHPYDAWVVPSEIAGHLLGGVLPDARIEVIGHGFSAGLLDRITVPATRAPGPGEPLRILTVGGWVPHKRQHLIPAVAATLRDHGIEFVWDLVGPPSRVARYQQAIIDQIGKLSLKDYVRARGAVPVEELAEFYEKAHLYVQPSTEEGFCMTALDAAAAGLPVIGSPAGALPEICRLSQGALVPSTAEDLSSAIRHFIVAALWPSDAGRTARAVRESFTWRNAAERLETVYSELSLIKKSHKTTK